MNGPEDPDPSPGSPYYPRIILCIPGPWSASGDLAAPLRDQGYLLEGQKLRSEDGKESFDADFRGADPRMVQAFKASACRLRPSFTPGDYQSLGEHRGVLYVLSDVYGGTTAGRQAARMIGLACRLLDAGGIAVKSESSGIAHSGARWRELEHRLPEGAAPLFDAFVRLPIINEANDLYSSGMHLLGRPDGIVSLRHFPGPDIRGAAQALETLLRALLEGQEPAHASLGPCTLYAETDYFWNRWGRYRMNGR